MSFESSEASASSPKRCLVIRSGAVGDVLVSFPALHGLNRVGPDVRVTLAARTEARLLAREEGLAHAVADFGAPFFLPLYSRSSSPTPGEAAFRAWLEQFDCTVSLLDDPDEALAGRLRRLGARTVHAFGGMRSGEAVSRQLFRVLAPLGIQSYPAERALLSSSREPPRALPGRFVMFHVGSGSPRKNWPAALFAALGEDVLAAGYEVFLPGGEADSAPVADVSQRLCKRFGERCSVVAYDLVSLASVIARAALFVGNDSGITHLAALLGVPTIAIFGPTDPVVWRPHGPRVGVVQGGPGCFPDLDQVRRSGMFRDVLDDA